MFFNNVSEDNVTTTKDGITYSSPTTNSLNGFSDHPQTTPVTNTTQKTTAPKQTTQTTQKQTTETTKPTETKATTETPKTHEVVGTPTPQPVDYNVSHLLIGVTAVMLGLTVMATFIGLGIYLYVTQTKRSVKNETYYAPQPQYQYSYGQPQQPQEPPKKKLKADSRMAHGAAKHYTKTCHLRP